MPVYEYTCKSCESSFEHLHRTLSDAVKPPACPECGSPKTARRLSVFAVGGEAKSGASGPAATPGMCGRCGGPGPCAMD